MKALRHGHCGSASAHARAFGKDINLPAVRCVGNSVVFLMCLSFPYPRARYIACGAVAGPGEGQEKVAWLHAVRKKYSVHVAVQCMHGFAGLQGCGCHLERKDFVPACLLVLACLRSCIASRSPGHTFTVVRSQGCWLGQISRKPFALLGWDLWSRRLMRRL